MARSSHLTFDRFCSGSEASSDPYVEIEIFENRGVASGPIRRSSERLTGRAPFSDVDRSLIDLIILLEWTFWWAFRLFSSAQSGDPPEEEAHRPKGGGH